jgi:ATP/maltotriose-dependent transcriptional regulator MalT
VSRQQGNADLVRQAHLDYEERRFGAAYQGFTRASDRGELTAEDIATWGDAAWWLGKSKTALELAELGHDRLLADGQTIRAAKEAIGLGFLLILRGDLSAGSGWIQRGRSLLEENAGDPAYGYVLALDGERARHRGDFDVAIEMSQKAVEFARTGRDPSLEAMALMTEGRALIDSGNAVEGLAKLDQAMLPVGAGKVQPETVGNLFCQMIEVCWELVDLKRAREWTRTTEQWCEEFDSAAMFSGICRMHRVQLSQVAGDWDTATAEAETVSKELVGMNTRVVAEGHYLKGDLLRLRGAGDEAEAAYLLAHSNGRSPEPGMSLLRAGRGELDAAIAALQRALESWRGPEYGRARLLAALVEVAVKSGDESTARSAAVSLQAVAERWLSDGLAALAFAAEGAVELTFGDARAAADLLGASVALWRELDAVYECARARLALAESLAQLGDHAGAGLERDAAASTMESLGVSPEGTAPSPRLPGALTPREAEVLLAVAKGGTNKHVADALFISEKTVARHLANIFVKIDVSTRTAAVAWAHGVGLDGLHDLM